MQKYFFFKSRLPECLTFHDGTKSLPDGETAAAKVLSECQLEEKERQSAKEEHYAVGDEKGS